MILNFKQIFSYILIVLFCHIVPCHIIVKITVPVDPSHKCNIILNFSLKLRKEIKKVSAQRFDYLFEYSIDDLITVLEQFMTYIFKV